MNGNYDTVSFHLRLMAHYYALSKIADLGFLSHLAIENIQSLAGEAVFVVEGSLN